MLKIISNSTYKILFNFSILVSLFLGHGISKITGLITTTYEYFNGVPKESGNVLQRRKTSRKKNNVCAINGSNESSMSDMKNQINELLYIFLDIYFLRNYVNF